MAASCIHPAAAQEADAAAHLRAAQRQAQGSPVLQRAYKEWCSPAAAPATAALAVQRLQAAEAEHQGERGQPRPDAGRLRLLVVQRSCAAHHASRLQPGKSHPVWLHTALEIIRIQPGPAGFEVQAKASTLEGPVVNSRITFSRGQHHACFASTDAAGIVSCTLIDTHPHGSRLDAWVQAHEGPFIATLAGSVTAGRVEMPAVVVRELPAFAGNPLFR